MAFYSIILFATFLFLNIFLKNSINSTREDFKHLKIKTSCGNFLINKINENSSNLKIEINNKSLSNFKNDTLILSKGFSDSKYFYDYLRAITLLNYAEIKNTNAREKISSAFLKIAKVLSFCSYLILFFGLITFCFNLLREFACFLIAVAGIIFLLHIVLSLISIFVLTKNYKLAKQLVVLNNEIEPEVLNFLFDMIKFDNFLNVNTTFLKAFKKFFL